MQSLLSLWSYVAPTSDSTCSLCAYVSTQS